jgi:hypothetical protein
LITFTCPACSGKCQVGDEFAGRKMRCPKCATRIRHHKDGTIELLTVGQPPPAAPAAVPAAAPSAVPAPPSEPPKKETTVEIGLVTEVAGKLLTQQESKQNTLIAWGVVAFIVASLAVVGLVMGDLKLAVAPVALALVAGFVWLAVRAKRRAPPPSAPKASPKPAGDEGKTEPLPKV